MVALGTAAMFVPGGQAIGLALTGYGAYQMHRAREDASEAHTAAWVDFNSGSVGYTQYHAAWAQLDDASRHYYFWQAANVVFAGLDTVQAVHFLGEIRAGRELEAMDQLFRDGKAEQAFARARSSGRLSEEAAYARMRELEALHPELAGSADRMVGELRARLQSLYGNEVQLLRAPADVFALNRFNEQLQAAVRSGRVTVQESLELSQAAMAALSVCRGRTGGCVVLKMGDLSKSLTPAAIARARAVPRGPASEAPALEHEVSTQLLAEYRGARARGLLSTRKTQVPWGRRSPRCDRSPPGTHRW
jgi:hypothetical protein